MSLSLISDYSASERFLKRRSLSPQIHSLSHYKVNIFPFLTVVLAMYYSGPERFLIIELVIRQKNFFISISLRGKIIFLKKYLSNILALMPIEKILRIELVIRQKFFSSYLIKGLIYFLFWSAILINNYRIVERFLKNRRLVLVISLSYLIKSLLYFYFLRAVLVNNYNTLERFLIIELVYGISISYP